ncbi:MAG TPA: RNA polymerase sigma factor [Steroidobacteraceae bacterium]|jgi:RNA polymerase sigma-70 factor (ECF subfamily)
MSNLAAEAAGDDAGLVQRIAAGDRPAFAVLMRRYNRRLYRLARAVLRDDAEAEDALQEAYLSAYRSMAQFRGTASVCTWLSRLVLNECLGRMRRNARRQNVIPIVRATAEAEMDGMSDEDRDRPDQALARGQMRAILERKLDALPDSFRAVFVLRSVEELSVEETAQCLGITDATVRSRHFRARSLLREGLAQDIDLAERDLFDFGGSHCDAVTARVMQRL